MAPDDHDAKLSNFGVKGLIIFMKDRLSSEDPKDLTVNFLEKGDTEIEAHFNALYAYGASLPMNKEDFDEKLEAVRVAQKAASLQDYMLQIWTAVEQEDLNAVYGAVCAFFKALDKMEITQPISPSTSRKLSGGPDMEALQTHWTQPYVGPSCDILRNDIREYEGKFSDTTNRKYYSKTITFVQSSGAGKSRLANEYGSICPMMTFIIREPNSGFPPSDNEVYHFMCSSPPDKATRHLERSPDAKRQDGRADYIWFHAIAIGILQGTFLCCNQKVKDFKKHHEQKDQITLAKSFKQFLENATERKNFCGKIVNFARNISESCVKDRTFRRIFDEPDECIRRHLEESKCQPMKNFQTAIDRFEASLQLWDLLNENDPFFTIVFDEVGSLMGEAGNGRFIALNRIISVISEHHKMWYLFLSTASSLDALLPPDRVMPQASAPNRPSLRLVDRDTQPLLNRFPPFTSFAVDMEDLKNGFLVNPTDESMSAFSKVTHMGRFGRALWSAYSRPDLVACEKLIGGKKEYNPTNRDHVFAVLSIRLCLDVDISNPITYPLSQTAVHLHMRVVRSIDPSTGYLFTRTPSEPVLALAAAHHLCPDESWSISLKTFTSNLLSLGAIDKGSKGELFARLMLTLARDHAVKNTLIRDSNSESVVPPFSVKSFLQALFSKNYHESISSIDSTILDSRLNFLMFTSTKERLSNDSFDTLCYTLLRRSAALQCASNQESYDLFIPFYCGDPDEKYNLAKAGAILVQVKNRDRKASPELLLGECFTNSSLRENKEPLQKRAQHESSEKVLFHNKEAKLLYILLDLGVDAPDVKVSFSKCSQPRVWSVHSIGHDEKVFGCINKHKAADATKDFFADLVKPAWKNDIAFHHDADLLKNVLKHDRVCK